MKNFAISFGVLLSLGCRTPAPKNVAEAKAQEPAYARMIASVATGCSISKVILDPKNTQTSGETTIYRGDACGTKIAVPCQSVMFQGEPSTACKVLPDEPSSGPVDQTFSVSDAESHQKLMELVAPCKQRALATYPDAKKRYLAGLPKGHRFFVVVRLKDAKGRSEQVFISVNKIADGEIDGAINNEIQLVDGYKMGQAITTPEDEIVDWVIVRPDGSEEGNWTGKFMEAYQAAGAPPKGICDPID
jgi:uncharacterized protein YegJ (DUF2314 family)